VNPISIILIGGVIVAIIAVAVGLFVSLRSEKSAVEERLDRYVEGERQPEAKDKSKSSSMFSDWLNGQVIKTSFGDTISRDLARADLKLKPGEFIAMMVIAAVGVALLVWLITVRKFNTEGFLSMLIGGAIGMFLPRIYVKSQQGRRLVHFNEQLSDMLNLMVNGLRAGYSTMQAMEAVSKELPPPICDEFRRVVQEMQLGVSMQVALDNLLRRIPSEDLDLVITAINVQREVGGNLAEILDTISYTIRERVRIKGEIRVLTTQVMYSGRFLSMMPLFVMGILYLLNRPYMMEFFNPKNNATLPCGYIALACAAILIMTGYAVMNKIGDIEV
jgi:tight adherence protein B